MHERYKTLPMGHSNKNKKSPNRIPTHNNANSKKKGKGSTMRKEGNQSSLRGHLPLRTHLQRYACSFRATSSNTLQREATSISLNHATED